MNRFRLGALKIFAAVAVCDMGFGRTMANLTYGTFSDELWTGTFPYSSAYGWIGDIIVGLIAGVTGIVILVNGFNDVLQEGPA